MTTLADQLLTNGTLRRVEVNGVAVFIKPLALGDARKAMRDAEKSDDPELNALARMAVLMVCDSDGTETFSADDYDKFMSMDSRIALPILEVVKEVAGVADDEDDALGKSEGTSTSGSDAA